MKTKRYSQSRLERHRRNQLTGFSTEILVKTVNRVFPLGKNRLRRDQFFLHQGIRLTSGTV